MSEEIHEGGCQCGAVRYRAEGAPASTNACYCGQCRRHTGSVLPAFATWKLARFDLAGEVGSFRSSEKAVRQFCPRCGSPLFWRGDGRDEIDVLIGSLDAPERVGTPRYGIWAKHRLPWVAPPPGPEFPESGSP